MQSLSIYLVLDNTSNNKILTVMGEMSKYCWIVPVRNEKATMVEK